jgi:hypothetical protein
MSRSPICRRITRLRDHRAFERALHKAQQYGGASELLAAYRRT